MKLEIPLEEECHNTSCINGYDYDRDTKDEVPCKECKGTGIVLSEAGLELIAFLKKYKDLL